jgi:hypothetical protein
MVDVELLNRQGRNVCGQGTNLLEMTSRRNHVAAPVAGRALADHLLHRRHYRGMGFVMLPHITVFSSVTKSIGIGEMFGGSV